MTNFEFPVIDHEAEAAECLAWLNREVARRDAEWAAKMSHHIGPQPSSVYNPQDYGFEHTPALGQQVLTLVQQAGYPKAQLIGSVATGRASLKDIDVLVPLRTLKAKQRFVQAMRELFNPSQMAQARGLAGLAIVAMPYGVLDFFFLDPR